MQPDVGSQETIHFEPGALQDCASTFLTSSGDIVSLESEHSAVLDNIRAAFTNHPDAGHQVVAQYARLAQAISRIDNDISNIAYLLEAVSNGYVSADGNAANQLTEGGPH